MSTQTDNPAFSKAARHFRTAAAELRTGGDVLQHELHRPEMNFNRAIRYFEAIARLVEQEKLLRAYRMFNTLTDAPAHPTNSVWAKAGKMKSLRKTVAARLNGSKGGRSKSWLKQEAARANGKRGGRPQASTKLPRPSIPSAA
jgi:hypothetical protein